MEPGDVIDIADVLDMPEAIEARDPSRLLWSLATAGAQARQAARSAAEALGRWDGSERPRSLLVAGDAAGSVSADVLVNLAGDLAPSVSWHAAELPRWAGPADALFVSSWTGEHPRLASLVDQASRRGLLTVVAAPVDSPAAAAGARGVIVEVGSDTPRRAALWSLLTPLLVAADRLGLVRGMDEQVAAAADALDTMAELCRPTGDAFTNPAKQLAIEFAETIPVIAGAGAMASMAARWFVDSLILFAGTPAVAASLPDDIALVGSMLESGVDASTSSLEDRYAGPSDEAPFAPPASSSFGDDDFFRDRTLDEVVRRPRLVVIGDDGPDDDPELIPPERRGTAELGEIAARRAARAVHDIASRRGLRSSGVESPGGSPLVRFAAASAFGDFTAAYLAIGRGVDPGAERPGERPF